MQPPATDEECEELRKDAEQAVAEDIEGGQLPNDTALVTAKHSSAGKIKAIQPADLVKSGKEAGYAPSTKSPGDPFACEGDYEMKYSSNSQCNCDHAEAKIIEKVVQSEPKGGSLTMRINWNKSGKLSPKPCRQCQGSICKAAEVCEIEIYLCVGDPQKKKQAPCKTTRHKPAKAKTAGRPSTSNWKTPRGFWS